MLKIFPVYFHTCSHKYVENIYFLHSQVVKLSVCLAIQPSIEISKNEISTQRTTNQREDEDVLTEIPDVYSTCKIDIDTHLDSFSPYIQPHMFIYVCVCVCVWCTAYESWAVYGSTKIGI